MNPVTRASAMSEAYSLIVNKNSVHICDEQATITVSKQTKRKCIKEIKGLLNLSNSLLNYKDHIKLTGVINLVNEAYIFTQKPGNKVFKDLKKHLSESDSYNKLDESIDKETLIQKVCTIFVKRDFWRKEQTGSISELTVGETASFRELLYDLHLTNNNVSMNIIKEGKKQVLTKVNVKASVTKCVKEMKNLKSINSANFIGDRYDPLTLLLDKIAINCTMKSYLDENPDKLYKFLSVWTHINELSRFCIVGRFNEVDTEGATENNSKEEPDSVRNITSFDDLGQVSSYYKETLKDLADLVSFNKLCLLFVNRRFFRSFCDTTKSADWLDRCLVDLYNKKQNQQKDEYIVV